MNAWRVSLERHAKTGKTAFSGEGSRLYGGRWNSKGVTVVYASATLSLAALEYLVHADVRLLSAAKLVTCAATWPDDLKIETASASAYGSSWRDTPAPRSLAEFGDRWIAEQRSAVLLVRSALIPSEMNLLINPSHPDARHITYAAPAAFSFDPRLL